MDYAPNPSTHLPPPTDRILYPPPPSSIPPHPLEPSLLHYNAPPLTTLQPPHAPLYHYTTPSSPPPHDAPPPPYSYHSTVISRYGSAPPTPVENPPPPLPLPLPDPPHYVAPPPYNGDVVQQPAPMPSQGYDFSSASYYRKYALRYGQGYDPFPDPYEIHAGPPGSVYSVSKYSYQRTAYQSRGFDPNGYPQVVNGVSTHYPQYPPAKSVPSSQTQRPYPPKGPKHKKPKTKPPKHACVLCKIACSTVEDLEVHRQGKKHQRNLEKLQGSTTSNIGPQSQLQPQPQPQLQKTDDLPKSPSQLVERKRKGMSTSPCSLEELELKKKRVYNAGAPAEMVRVCGVCNIVVNSQKVFELHCAGSKHAMMLKKLQEDL